MVPKTERFEMRLDEHTLHRVDEWRQSYGDGLSRSEAMRRLIEIGLASSPKDSVRFTDGEKLLVMMLRDLYLHLKVKDGDIDPSFVSEVVWGGHYWAPKLEMPGLFHDHEDDPHDLREVVDILDMWDTIERGYEKLSKKDKELVAKEVGLRGDHVRFPGFDGNNEAAHLGIARFFINKMGRFSRFDGRELNSHIPLRSAYHRMLPAFQSMRKGARGGELGAKDIVALLNVMQY